MAPSAIAGGSVAPGSDISVVAVDDGIALLELAGDFDFRQRDAFDQLTGELLEQGIDLIIDLNATGFADSLALQRFHRLSRHAYMRGRVAVFLLDASAPLERIFALTAFDLAVDRAQTSNEAIEIIRQHRSDNWAGA